MTTVVSWINIPTSPTDVAVNFLDQSSLLLSSVERDPKAGTVTSSYVLNSGALTRNTTVKVLVRANKDLSFTYELTLTTYRTVTVDDVVTEDKPATLKVSWTVASLQDDAASVLSYIGALYGLMMNGVTSKVPNTGIVGKISRLGLAELY